MPLYIHIRIGDCDWYAHGWRAGAVDAALLLVTFFALRAFYQALCFFLSEGR